MALDHISALQNMRKALPSTSGDAGTDKAQQDALDFAIHVLQSLQSGRESNQIPLSAIRDWAQRRISACGPAGVTDQVALLEDAVRWGERQVRHSAVGPDLQGELERLARFADQAMRMSHADMRNNLNDLADWLTKLSSFPPSGALGQPSNQELGFAHLPTGFIVASNADETSFRAEGGSATGEWLTSRQAATAQAWALFAGLSRSSRSPQQLGESDMSRLEAEAFASTNEPTALLRHWWRNGFAAAAGSQAADEARCANCGKCYSDADKAQITAEYPEEGEWFCTAECKSQHDELECPALSHDGYRHPGEARRLIEAEARLRALVEAKPVAFTVPDGAGGVNFGRGWRFGPVPSGDATMPLFAAAVLCKCPQRLVFPTIVRKMWSGAEVQQWLDEQMGFVAPVPEAKGSLERYRAYQAAQGATDMTGTWRIDLTDAGSAAEAKPEAT